jgi:hypothetical protein
MNLTTQNEEYVSGATQTLLKNPPYQCYLVYSSSNVDTTQWLIGGFNPPEKYESQIGSSSKLLGKMKNVWNHQLAFVNDMNIFQP